VNRNHTINVKAIRRVIGRGTKGVKLAGFTHEEKRVRNEKEKKRGTGHPWGTKASKEDRNIVG